ncbi:MAG: hypothetical protein AAFQ94_02235 [Bacteroidota bacterium]
MTTSQTFSRQSDQGITSPSHSKYVGQFVFSKDPAAIQYENEKPELFDTKFKASEPLYTRLYLKKSITNTPHNGEKSYNAVLMYSLKINGKTVPHIKSFGSYRHFKKEDLTYYTEELNGSEQQDLWTTWRLALLPMEHDPEMKYGNVNIAARSFVLALLSEPAGEHTIELQMHSQDFNSSKKTEVLVKGSFTLQVTEADKKKLAFMYTPPLPVDEWQDGNKQALVKELAEAFQKELDKKPILVGLYGRGWNEGTYSLSGQKYRKLSAWAVFEDTNGDGQVPITTFNWISDYSGSTWTRLRFDSHCLSCPDWNVEVAAVKAVAGK